jgi:hypothetical protein
VAVSIARLINQRLSSLVGLHETQNLSNDLAECLPDAAARNEDRELTVCGPSFWESGLAISNPRLENRSFYVFFFRNERPLDCSETPLESCLAGRVLGF